MASFHAAVKAATCSSYTSRLYSRELLPCVRMAASAFSAASSCEKRGPVRQTMVSSGSVTRSSRVV